MAQDIHFSQFYMAPLQLNPAMTGVMNCSQRIGVNYRNQWASVLRDKAFQTSQVAYDAKIPVGRYDYFGLGGSIWSDVAGSLNFRSTLLNLDFAYTKKMGGYRKKASYLSMGAKVGLAQRGLNLLDAKWGSQNADGTWNPNLPSGEVNFGANGRDNYLFADVSAGLLWFSVLDENNNFYFGGAYDHINRANQSFTTDKTVPLLSKFTVHAGGEFQTSDRITVLPGIVTFLQGPYLQVNGGTSMRFLLGNSKRSAEAIQFGLWTRLGAHRHLLRRGAKRRKGRPERRKATGRKDLAGAPPKSCSPYWLANRKPIGSGQESRFAVGATSFSRVCCCFGRSLCFGVRCFSIFECGLDSPQRYCWFPCSAGCLLFAA